jgi:hypothetical protein
VLTRVDEDLLHATREGERERRGLNDLRAGTDD